MALLMFFGFCEGKANPSRASLLGAKGQLASYDRNLSGSRDGDGKGHEGRSE